MRNELEEKNNFKLLLEGNELLKWTIKQMEKEKKKYVCIIQRYENEAELVELHR